MTSIECLKKEAISGQEATKCPIASEWKPTSDKLECKS